MVAFVPIILVAVLLHKTETNAYSIQSPGQEVKHDPYDDSWMHSRAHSIPTSENTRKIGNEGEDDEHEDFWYRTGQDALLKTMRHVPLEAEAKNIIMFLGDGMSLPTVTAARIFQGQQKGQSGEEGSLYFESFPNVALSKTFCSDSQVADSACSATAYLCGSKANIGTIGVSPRVKEQADRCTEQQNPDNQLSSILTWAQAAGKSTGVVTTTRITHASPAGTYAHVSHRDFENDAKVRDLGGDPNVCDDIAEQLILNKPGQDINVILGGGRRQFVPLGTFDPEDPILEGLREDGKNLINTWKDRMEVKGGKYVTSRQELLDIDPKSTNHILGLFSPDHLAYKESLGEKDDPSLKEMVQAAIKILSKNPKGFFLFVEGGRIDHAHHDNYAQRALVETLEFDDAIKAADQMTRQSETLIVVTADHSHVMTINGYPTRGNNILQKSGEFDAFGLPYTTLSYANGPGYRPPVKDEDDVCQRANLDDDPVPILDTAYQQETMFKLPSETHGGDDVGIFAKGPFAHLFSGVQHQSYIPHVMAYASCIGPRKRYC